jgi:murein L,D-transpeptidase YafK
MFIKSLISVGVLGLFLLPETQSWADQPQTSRRSERAIKRTVPKLSAELAKHNHKLGDPIFLRIIKSAKPQAGKLSDGYIEIFIGDEYGKYSVFKSLPICAASGTQGPKTKTGDYQSPEGFYFLKADRFNPNSSYHLSLNMGYPNAYDRAHGYTGNYLMIHGKCVSIGCYAMTDKGINDIYTLASAALENDQSVIRVHSFPFPLTPENLSKTKSNKNHEFWKNLKQGWDWFELNNSPPDVHVKNKKYTFRPLPAP